jgi:hypothetical protein
LNFAPRLDSGYASKPKNSAFNAMWLKTRHYGIILFRLIMILFQGGTVVMACRDLSKANEAAAKVTEQTKSQLVHVLKLDLASLDSIREFAAAFKAKLNRLDILINNAGISFNLKIFFMFLNDVFIFLIKRPHRNTIPKD